MKRWWKIDNYKILLEQQQTKETRLTLLFCNYTMGTCILPDPETIDITTWVAYLDRFKPAAIADLIERFNSEQNLEADI